MDSVSWATSGLTAMVGAIPAIMYQSFLCTAVGDLPGQVASGSA
jgi:hypothetical protein